jgi:hypothetical protein
MTRIWNRLNPSRSDFSIPVRLASIAFWRALLPVRLQPQGMNQCCRQLVRLKSKRPRSALICNAAFGVDQVDAIRPARIGLFGRIAKFVEHGRKLYTEFSHASPSDEGAIFFSFRARKNHLVLDIALHLPNVAGMRFGNVDHQESNPPAILLVELIEGGNLPPERRSSVATEYQNHGPPLV